MTSQTPLLNISSSGTDSYKFSHHMMYPPGMTNTHVYMAPRWKPDGWADAVVPFGSQYAIKRYLAGQVVTAEQVATSYKRVGKHLGSDRIFNYAGWMHIVEQHGGRLPLRIVAVPEGTVVPTGTVLMIVEGTCEHCAWLPNWVDPLLTQTWGATTVATYSWNVRNMIRAALEESADDISKLPFMHHDFGFRGASCPEEAAIKGAGHLVCSLGTDTFIACDLLAEYYGEEMAGFSIAASEHSVMSAWPLEVDAMRNILEKFPSGLVACVSDTNDIWNACTNLWGKELKAEVLGRAGTLVVRPDSGEVPETPVRVIETLGEAFGSVVNSKGFRKLPPGVAVIQGDGMDMDSMREVIRLLLKKKWAVDNIAFGSGGGLYRRHRDELGFNMKLSAGIIDGQEREFSKAPTTDHRKDSKRGRQKVVNGVEVYRDGTLLVDHHLSDIRVRASGAP